MSRSSDCQIHSHSTLLILGLLSTCIHGFPSPELFPFGVSAGDLAGPRGDDSASSPVILPVPFTFIGTEYSQIVVNSNGVLSFESSFTSCCSRSRVFPRISPPLIAPFWHDFDPTVGGNIYYRQTNDSQQLQLFSSALNMELNDFFPTRLFIATWDQVPQYFGSPLVNNTLQVVLATDGVQTLAVFIYKDINWGERAQIGFNVGDGYTSFIFPEALSDQTRNILINEYSNVGEPGVFVYRIDKPPLLKLSGILPFGADVSDLPGPPGDDSASKPLTLGVPFPFFGKEYSKIIVNSNGVLSFNTIFTNCCPPRNFPLVSPPLIAPFWQDFDLTDTSEGGIYYRQTDDPIYLELVHILLNNVDDVGDLVHFFPTQLFISTWEQVPEYGGSTSINNTFQVLLSTDGTQTVSIFIYHDIRWGDEAQMGFNAGDGHTSFTLPDALTEQTSSIDQRSNVGDPGVFVYRIDVPTLSCNAPVSSNGVITVNWSHIHTGGLPLTNVSVSYTHSVPGNGSIVTNSQQPNTVSISNVDTTSIVFHNLVTGAEYVFNITVENSYGSSSFTCGLTPHIIARSSTNIGAIVGGAVGGSIVLLGIVLLLILILVKVSIIRRGKTKIGGIESVLLNRVASVRITTSDLESEAVYEEPGSLPRHLQPVSLRDLDSMVRLEECPAYGVSTIGAS